jgi:hypothetical protein
VANLRIPPKRAVHQIQIFDDKAQLVSKFLVTQVSCGAVHRKLLEPVSGCELERPTGTRTPTFEPLCALIRRGQAVTRNSATL